MVLLYTFIYYVLTAGNKVCPTNDSLKQIGVRGLAFYALVVHNTRNHLVARKHYAAWYTKRVAKRPENTRNFAFSLVSSYQLLLIRNFWILLFLQTYITAAKAKSSMPRSRHCCSVWYTPNTHFYNNNLHFSIPFKNTKFFNSSWNLNSNTVRYLRNIQEIIILYRTTLLLRHDRIY